MTPDDAFMLAKLCVRFGIEHVTYEAEVKQVAIRVPGGKEGLQYTIVLSLPQARFVCENSTDVEDLLERRFPPGFPADE